MWIALPMAMRGCPRKGACPPDRCALPVFSFQMARPRLRFPKSTHIDGRRSGPAAAILASVSQRYSQ